MARDLPIRRGVPPVCGTPVDLPPASRQRRVRYLQADGSAGAGTGPDTGIDAFWGIAAEVPVEIGLNGRPWTVMMATPADLEDFATGIAVTEGLLADPRAIQGIAMVARDRGIALDLQVDPAALAALPARSLEGRTGCGLCGLERLSQLAAPQAGAAPPALPDLAAVARAFAALEAAQPLNRATRSVHGAAFCAPDGAIRLVREDVGRHNALDKLLGALLRGGLDPAAGFVAMTSRCSFELVQKAARVRVPLLATVSAPTGLALEVAARAGLTLVARGPQGTLVAFDPDEGAPDAR
ncbi:MAG: formate dehydrogenase accessory sulfurtransferase FdhD [Sneathiellaceae bacterium]